MPSSGRMGVVRSGAAPKSVAVVNIGSSTVNVVGLPIARLNDSTDAGQMTQGSPTVYAGG